MLTLAEVMKKAEAMRQAPTLSESRAQDSFPRGLHVERQVVFGFYILDFVVPAKMLALEIDGESHADQRAHDAKRDAFCLKHGLRVLRVPNGLANQAGALAAGYPNVEGAAALWEKAQRKAAHRQAFVEGKHAVPSSERRAAAAANKADRTKRQAAALRAIQAGELPPWNEPTERIIPPPVRGAFMGQPKRKDTPEQKAERRAIKKERRNAGKVESMASRIAALAAVTEW